MAKFLSGCDATNLIFEKLSHKMNVWVGILWPHDNHQTRVASRWDPASMQPYSTCYRDLPLLAAVTSSGHDPPSAGAATLHRCRWAANHHLLIQPDSSLHKLAPPAPTTSATSCSLCTAAAPSHVVYPHPLPSSTSVSIPSNTPVCAECFCSSVWEDLNF
ncbi:hypothetical protein VPH35_066136 [Triticum aestivum]